jgi:hypothetical protein
MIAGEILGVIRNLLERLIAGELQKKENKYVNALNGACLRAVSSLIAVQAFQQIADAPGAQQFLSISFIIIFIYLNVFFKEDHLRFISDFRELGVRS